MKAQYFIYTLVLSLFVTTAHAQIISTVAGQKHIPGYYGDERVTDSALFNTPWDACADAAKNIYIVDRGNHAIRKIDNGGIVHTVAGNGTPGYSGDNGPATLAQLNDPAGVIVDSRGDIYISEYNNARIRKVYTSGLNAGKIITIAGTGVNGFSGDGGLATAAKIAMPAGMCIDAGDNIYFADSWNVRIRKITAAGIITTVAGTQYNGYTGDGGPAILARLDMPVDVAVDAHGNIYIADNNNFVIRKVNASGIISTVAGTNQMGYNGDNIPATSAKIKRPEGVCVDPHGNFYFTDEMNHRVRKVDNAGIITTVVGTGSIVGPDGDGGPATAATVAAIHELSIDAEGNMYLPTGSTHTLRKITKGFGTVQVTLTGNEHTGQANIYPNPSQGNINIDIEGIAAQAVTVTIYNVQGAVFGTRTYTLVKGPNTIVVNDMKLPAGQYFVRIHDNEMHSIVRSLVVMPSK